MCCSEAIIACVWAGRSQGAPRAACKLPCTPPCTAPSLLLLTYSWRMPHRTECTCCLLPSSPCPPCDAPHLDLLPAAVELGRTAQDWVYQAAALEGYAAAKVLNAAITNGGFAINKSRQAGGWFPWFAPGSLLGKGAGEAPAAAPPDLAFACFLRQQLAGVPASSIEVHPRPSIAPPHPPPPPAAASSTTRSSGVRHARIQRQGQTQMAACQVGI